ncbi:MAG: protein-glutamate O-methyltransferase CheR [Gammaproteobacteria bacterium]|nr:protein-glutamate O-methyltransferase CheR [Gammaproteobacteria bacterium]
MGPMPEEDVYFKTEDYRVFQAFLERACGIVLSDNKQYLVANRIRRVLSTHHLETLAELVKRIEQNPRSSLKEQIIDAMTTNETFWFRDVFPFEVLRDVLMPRLLVNERRDTLRIWSAACSSGQEPYSISMIVEEFKARNPGIVRRDPSIIATDISSKVLTAARDARYDQATVNRGLSDQRRDRFFNQASDGLYELQPGIVSRVEFRALNLLESFAGLGTFDIVFCRNVLIYFSMELKCDILRRIRATLSPGAFLVLGASESMPSGVAALYEPVRVTVNATVYRARP